MPDHTQTLCSALEYEALKNLDKMVRLAMTVPNTSGFLVTAIQSLDQVRIDQGLPMPEKIELPPPPVENSAKASKLATALIDRAMKP